MKTTLASYTEASRPLGRAKLAGKSLTATIIKGMAVGEELADPEHPGLRVRCNRKKGKVGKEDSVQHVFFYRYRNASGALRQVEIGVLGPTKKLTDIRSEWQGMKDAVRNGQDPRAIAKAERQRVVAERRAEQVRALTVGNVIEQYLSELVEKKRKAKGAAETRRMLQQLIRLGTWAAEQRARDKAAGRRRLVLPKGARDVADLPAAEFTRSMAHDLLRVFGESAPRVAGMARQELRGAWRYAITAGRIEGPSPFEKVAGAAKDDFGGGALVSVSKRERWLSKEEVGSLLRWMDEPSAYSRTVHDALELVLRTGLRSGEVCAIHSRELSRRDGVLWLDVPAARMKGKKDHSVPLVGRAEKIVLARMPEKDGYLFPSSRGQKPIDQKVLGVEVYACSGRSTAAAYKYRRICPVPDWAPHDLRRTARTLLAELGCPYEVAEAILAHTLPGVHGVYNRAQYANEKVDWLTRLGTRLDELAAAQAHLRIAKAVA